ncbi:Transcription factor TFIIIB component B [Clavispora lusitaniae]|nr:Transcription factor TFIIIB component B [Clavispora lusitaniae]
MLDLDTSSFMSYTVQNCLPLLIECISVIAFSSLFPSLFPLFLRLLQQLFLFSPLCLALFFLPCGSRLFLSPAHGLSCLLIPTTLLFFMSSVVKKSSHFVPKVKKKARRVPSLASSAALQASPPPSQASQPTQTNESAPNVSEPPEQSQNTSSFVASAGENTYVPPTPATQPSAAIDGGKIVSPLSSYSIEKTAKRASPGPEMDVDPRDASAAAELAVEDAESSDSGDHDEYGDNDIFKQPQEPRQHRRSSVAGPRRLSTISRRSGSISVAPGGLDEDSGAAPVAISIPVGKPTKRRASSSARAHKRAARASVISVPSAGAVLNEQDEIGSDSGSQRNSNPSTTTGPAHNGEAIVVGLDPETQKLRKFRASPDVEGYDDLPVAPPDLVTEISEVSQIPHKIMPGDEPYYAKVKFQPDQLRMSDLCKPLLPIGSVSENYKMAMEAKAKIAQKRQLRREAREMAKSMRISYEEAYRKVLLDGNHEFELDEEKHKGFDFDAPEEANQGTGVQVEIIDNKISVRSESMIVGGQRPATLTQNRNVTLENPFENPITSNSYTKSAHTDAWTDEEVIQLYKALSTWGTDFTFIAQLFPYRTRRQVKRKFILEEKKNPELVELALRRKLPADIREFQSAASNIKLKNVEEHEREMQELKKDHERHMEEINMERERAIKEDLEASRKREIEIRTGAKPMTRMERQREFRKNETVVGSIEDVKKTREELERAAG